MEQTAGARFGDNSFLRMPPGHHPSTLAEALDFWSCRTDPVCVSEKYSLREAGVLDP